MPANTNPKSYTSLDDDLILGGVESYARTGGGGSGRRIYRLKGSMTVRFLTDPWTRNQDHGWHFYREVAAFDGLRGGFQLPNGLKEFPVNDQITFTDPDTGQTKRQYAPRGTDPILELVVPSSMYPPADGRVKGQDKVAINVLNEEGEHIVLKLSGARGADLLRTMLTFREMDEKFTCTTYPWTLTIQGSGAASTLSVKPHKNEAPVELPDPIDLVEMFGDIRREVEEYVDGLRGGGADTVEDELVDSDEESWASVDQFEEAVASAEAIVEPRDKFSAMSDVRIKTLLTKAGVKIPAKSTRSALIELASTHL